METKKHLGIFLFDQNQVFVIFIELIKPNVVN